MTASQNLHGLRASGALRRAAIGVRGVLVLAAACLATPVHAEAAFSMAGGKTTTVLPFELIDNRVFVDAWLDGQGPFHLILDTGADGFSIADTVARKLGLAVDDGAQGSGVGEKKVRVGRTHFGHIRIGDLRFENVDARVFPLDDAPSVFGTKPLDGWVGLEVFRHVVVKHDYVRRQLTLTLPDRFRYQGRGMIVPFDRPSLIPIVDASLDGVAGKFGVDTGARSSLLLFGPFVEHNGLQAKYGARLEGVTGWGIGGPVRSLLARAQELRIGDVIVRDLVVRFSTQKKGATTTSDLAGLIGPDVLSQFDLTVDYARHRLIFEKNGNYGRRDSYDRAGMWMGQNGDRFAVVDVIAGGPADQAGIKAGDTILAIDGTSTSQLVLPDVRESIRRATVGRRMALILESAGSIRTAVVTLRDLV
jgi:hypothetical protein